MLVPLQCISRFFAVLGNVQGNVCLSIHSYWKLMEHTPVAFLLCVVNIPLISFSGVWGVWYASIYWQHYKYCISDLQIFSFDLRLNDIFASLTLLTFCLFGLALLYHDSLWSHCHGNDISQMMNTLWSNVGNKKPLAKLHLQEQFLL